MMNTRCIHLLAYICMRLASGLITNIAFANSTGNGCRVRIPPLETEKKKRWRKMAKIKLETKTILHTASKQMQKAEIQLLPNSIKTSLSFCKKFFTFSKCEKWSAAKNCHNLLPHPHFIDINKKEPHRLADWLACLLAQPPLHLFWGKKCPKICLGNGICWKYVSTERRKHQ